MGNAFLYGSGGGGGAGLNFEIKAYASEDSLPATAKENTIAVITETPITAYTFSATEHTDPIEGMVWFIVDVASPVEFNALKKNEIRIYPNSAKQYVSGVWTDKLAKSYQGGSWVDWIPPGALFYSGMGAQVEFEKYESANSTATIGTEYIELNYTVHDRCVVGVECSCGLAGKTKVVIDAEVTNVSSDNDRTLSLVCSTSKIDMEQYVSKFPARTKLAVNSRKEYTLDVSGFSGTLYIAVFGIGRAKIYNMIVE